MPMMQGVTQQSAWTLQDAPSNEQPVFEVTVVLVVAVVVVEAGAGASGAQSNFRPRGWRRCGPNWSVNATLVSADFGHFTL
jgi:hypothetical protein